MSSLPPLLHVLTYDLPNCSGLTLHARALAHAQAAAGYPVTVLSARFTKAQRREEWQRGVRAVRAWAPLRLSRARWAPFLPWHFARLVGQHRVVIAHTPLPELPLLAWWCEKKAVPLVLLHHGDAHLPPGVLNRWAERATAWAFRQGARRALRIVAYSEDYAQHSPWLAPFASKVVPIFPLVEIPSPEPLGVERWRKKLGPGPLLGFVGRFVAEKRPDLLLQAAALLMGQWPELRVVFVGPPVLPYESYLQRCQRWLQALGERVVFTGVVEERQALADLYGALDCLCLPSDTECFGLVQVEAMLCGTPVVATDIPGARVPVQLSGMGVLVPPGSAEALAQGVERLLRAREVFLKPQVEIAALFSREKTLRAWQQLLQS